MGGVRGVAASLFRFVDAKKYFLVSFGLGLFGVCILVMLGRDYIVLSSASIAIGGVVFTNAASLHSQRRDRAFAFLAKSVDDETFFAAMRTVRNVYWTARDAQLPISAIAANIHHLELERVDVNLRAPLQALFAEYEPDVINQAVIEVGNFFEQLAIAVKHRETNEDMLYDFYCGMFWRSYLYLVDFMPMIRNLPNVPGHSHGEAELPEIFSSLDWLFARWAPRYERRFKLDRATFQTVGERAG